MLNRPSDDLDRRTTVQRKEAASAVTRLALAHPACRSRCSSAVIGRVLLIRF